MSTSNASAATATVAAATATVAAAAATASPSASAAGSAAGSEWQKFVDDSSGATYFYNARSGESTWEEPAGFAASQSEEDAAGGAQKPPQWRRLTDESSGRVYYYDAANGVTQWDAPEGVDIPDASDDDGSGEDEGGEKADADAQTEARDDVVAEDSARGGTEAVERSGATEEAGETLTASESETPAETTAENRSEPKDPDADENNASTEKVAAVVTWVKHVDRASGKPYYHNPASGATQWEEPPAFVDAPPPSAAALEYQAHVNRTRTEKLARVTQQVLDPTGSLSRLNAILSGIKPAGAAAAASPDADGDDVERGADAEKPSSVEWQQHVDPHTQRFYYHNAVTGETQWQKPDAPIVSGLAAWVPPELETPVQDGASRRTVSGVSYASTAKFNRITGKFEPVGDDEYWERRGVASDRAGRQMSHFFDMTDLDKNRAEAKVIREKLKRQNIDWKKIAAEKKAKKQKQKNEWLYQD